MPALKPEAVGPYVALLAYARAAGAPNADAAKRLVDDVLQDDPNRPLPLLVGVIDRRAAALTHT